MRIQREPVLTIAGSDSSGGAGIQADLKTFAVFPTYGMSVITALTAQNTTGVQEILPVPTDFLEQQLDAVCTDIPPKAVKIGMVANSEQVDVICQKIKQYALPFVVVDPVMVATSGAELTGRTTIDTMKEQLFPHATVLTPNLPEAEALLGTPIRTIEAMQEAAMLLAEQYQTAVLLKGGHLDGDAVDILCGNQQIHLFRTERTHTKNTHGTGCTLSSAIAAYLAMGVSLPQSVQNAKTYVANCISAGLQLGQGNGPICHNYRLPIDFL